VRHIVAERERGERKPVEGPVMDKRDEHWSKTKHGDDGMREGNKNGVTSDDFRTLKPP
jgi:hypothetical protein